MTASQGFLFTPSAKEIFENGRNERNVSPGSRGRVERGSLHREAGEVRVVLGELRLARDGHLAVWRVELGRAKVPRDATRDQLLDRRPHLRDAPLFAVDRAAVVRVQHVERLPSEREPNLAAAGRAEDAGQARGGHVERLREHEVLVQAVDPLQVDRGGRHVIREAALARGGRARKERRGLGAVGVSVAFITCRPLELLAFGRLGLRRGVVRALAVGVAVAVVAVATENIAVPRVRERSFRQKDIFVPLGPGEAAEDRRRRRQRRAAEEGMVHLGGIQIVVEHEKLRVCKLAARLVVRFHGVFRAVVTVVGREAEMARVRKRTRG